MIDIYSISDEYRVRELDDVDAQMIYDLCDGNPQYYRYLGRPLSMEHVMQGLHETPPGLSRSAKHFIGFFDGDELAAVMDLVDGYPDSGTAYIGFFMVRKDLQGKGTGTRIIGKLCSCLKQSGFRAVRLGVEKDNPQSTGFWNKQGFAAVRETELEGRTVVVTEKTL